MSEILSDFDVFKWGKWEYSFNLVHGTSHDTRDTVRICNSWNRRVRLGKAGREKVLAESQKCLDNLSYYFVKKEVVCLNIQDILISLKSIFNSTEGTGFLEEVEKVIKKIPLKEIETRYSLMAKDFLHMHFNSLRGFARVLEDIYEGRMQDAEEVTYHV